MTKRTLYLLIFAALALAAAVVVLAVSGSGHGGEHSRSNLEELLAGLLRENQALDNTTLRLASLQVPNFDAIANQTRQLQEASQRFAKDPRLAQSGLDASAATYLRQVTRKLEILERIKAQTAILKNGLHYLPKAIYDLGPTLDVDQQALLQHILIRLQEYNLLPNEGTRARVVNLLSDSAISAPGRVRGGLGHVLFHVRSNLQSRDRQERLLGEYFDAAPEHSLRTISHAQAQFRERQAYQTSIQNLILLSLVLSLFLGLLFTLLRLQRARQTVHASHNQLRDAVESISEGFALFDAQNRLVLTNQRFAEPYPWLQQHLVPGASFDELARIDETVNTNRTGFLSRLAKAAESPRRLTFQLPDGRWLQASHCPTSDGGRALVQVDISSTKKTETELRRLSRAVEQSPVAVTITDRSARILYVNPRFEEITGYSAGEVLGRNTRMLKSGETSDTAYNQLWQTIQNGGQWRGELHNRCKDGSLFWASASISPLRDETGTITEFIAVTEDITARKQVAEQISLAAAVFAATSEAIMVTGADNRIVKVNPAFTQITGYSEADALGQNPSILSSGRQPRSFYKDLWNTLQSKGHWEGEIWNRRKNGDIYPEWLSLTVVKDPDDQVIHHVGVFSDITHRKEAEEKIRWQTQYDALTGLPNRYLFRDRLSRAIAAAERTKLPFALLSVNLDRFKVINDSFGHHLGDDLLCQAAERITGMLRGTDTVARLGADEFAIVLTELDSEKTAAIISEHLITGLTKSYNLDGRDAFVGASIGISLFPNDATEQGALARFADLALRRAKDAGRNTYRFYRADMDGYIEGRMQLENDLRKALAENQFHLNYQPIVDTETHQMLGAECLLRWSHPELGPVSPAAFIPLAEETGLIAPIGLWVLETACAQLGQWRKSGLPPFYVSVNVSSRQLDGHLSPKHIERILHRNNLPPEYLVLEITESMLIGDTDSSRQWVEGVRQLGVRLSVDDFGTGYSSLGYLKRFPVSTLKIDRSFIKDLPEDSEDASLTEAILGIARSLKLNVVAEGVETAEQVEFLRQRACACLQGYYFSRPVDGEQLVRFVTERAVVNA